VKSFKYYGQCGLADAWYDEASNKFKATVWKAGEKLDLFDGFSFDQAHAFLYKLAIATGYGKLSHEKYQAEHAKALKAKGKPVIWE
jgi:hypothetical protein